MLFRSHPIIQISFPTENPAAPAADLPIIRKCLDTFDEYEAVKMCLAESPAVDNIERLQTALVEIFEAPHGHQNRISSELISIDKPTVIKLLNIMIAYGFDVNSTIPSDYRNMYWKDCLKKIIYAQQEYVHSHLGVLRSLHQRISALEKQL